MALLTTADVCGTWLLESFEIEDPSKVVAPWGQDTTGLLIYADTGYMSVSINKTVENESPTEAENIFDAILFYSGTFNLDGEIIRHQVTNASKPSRIGKEMIRYAELKGDLLTLTTPQESFGRAILKWRKLKR
jgi:hypothetical protein